jgi:hypothetical protein
MDLLEDAGIPQPPPPIITPEDRAELAGIALAQRQMLYCFAFAGGLLAGAAIAYLIGYHDEIAGLVRWMLSGTGIAVALSLLNTQRLSGFKCPRCGENYFGRGYLFARQCHYCGLPLDLPGDAAAMAAVFAPVKPSGGEKQGAAESSASDLQAGGLLEVGDHPTLDGAPSHPLLR